MHTLIFKAVVPTKTKRQMFDVWWNGEHIGKMREPLFEGARVLAARGVAGSDLVTSRHQEATHDSFAPVRVDVAAALTVADPDNGRLRVHKWIPRDFSARICSWSRQQVSSRRHCCDR